MESAIGIEEECQYHRVNSTMKTEEKWEARNSFLSQVAPVVIARYLDELIASRVGK